MPQVPASLTPATTTAKDVRGRRSAMPEGAGKVVMSMTWNRSRVTFAPVLLVTLLRIVSVPNVELLGGSEVKSRTRFGAVALLTVASSRKPGMVLLRWIGEERFSGPGAP